MATTKDCIQLAMEETPRYEGAPTVTPYRVSTAVHYPVVQSARIGPAPSHLDRSDEVRGIEGAVPNLIETYEPDGNITIRAYLNSIVWLLETLGLTGTATTGDGIITDPDAQTIPAGATRWVFTKRGGITAKTMQILACYVDEAVFLKGQGFGTSNLTLNAAGAVTADLMGLVVGRVADPNLTPVFDAAAIVPARRGDFSIQSWLSGTGSTDDWSLAITNPLVRRRSLGLDPPSYFPDKMEHGDDRVRMTGSIPKSVADADDFDALLSAGTFAFKTRWKTTKVIGVTAYKYTMWVEAPAAQLVGGNIDEIANRRRFGGSFDWLASWDETAGYDFRITVVNSITSANLATYV